MTNYDANFFELKGHKLLSVTMEQIETDKGIFVLYHNQDCCEIVEPQEIIGDVNKVLNQVVLFAEQDEIDRGDTITSFTIHTENEEGITIVWKGSSNGYYSETVSVKFIPNE